MSAARSSQFPPVAIVARAKALPMARKPALEAREAERLRDERLMAMAFGATLDLLGISNVEAGEWLGGESTVRRLRAREKPLGARHLAKMPPHVANAVLVALHQVLRAPAVNDTDDGSNPAA